MTSAPEAIVRRGGISRTVFIISLVVVGAVSGATGYVIQGILHPAPPVTTLNGAGSTFVAPLIQAMDQAYSQTTTNIQINYQPIGSGGGITQLGKQTVDFGASDAPLNSNQTNTLGHTALTIPDTIGAVAIAYNLPGIGKGLQLNVNVTAQIFQGDITYWNDTRIKALNPAQSLPYQQIVIVRRFDSSGTTFVLSGYLKSSPLWRLGQSKSSGGWGGASGSNAQYGNQGVASYVQGTKYTIGYVELNYALTATPAMTYAYLWNIAGRVYIEPTLSSTSLAASSLPSLPAGNGNWTSINLLNSNDPGAYPIVTFSYIMVYQELNVFGSSMTQTRAQAIVNYLWFLVHDGQNQATPLAYIKLPSLVVTNAEATIKLMTYNGMTIHS